MKTTVTLEQRLDGLDGLDNLAGLPPIEFELLFDAHLTVRELIRRTVAEQVAIDRRTHTRAAAEIAATLAQGAYTTDEIGRQAASGAVRFPTARQLARQRSRADIDLDAATERALNGFTQGLYLLMVDGRIATDLDQTLTLGARTSVVFVRLTPLFILGL